MKSKSFQLFAGIVLAAFGAQGMEYWTRPELSGTSFDWTKASSYQVSISDASIPEDAPTTADWIIVNTNFSGKVSYGTDSYALLANCAHVKLQNGSRLEIEVSGADTAAEWNSPVNNRIEGMWYTATIAKTGAGTLALKSCNQVTSDGGDAVTERGIYFGTTPDPAATGTKIVASSGGTGSFFCTMTGLVERNTYYVCAYATNGQGTSYGSEKSFSLYYYVDLGLPSGLLWATCNVGADSPEDYGDCFAWGETTTKSTYDWGTYQYCQGGHTWLTKYCNESSHGYNGFTDHLTTLLPEDDAATANWGGDWRMPSSVEWLELYNNTTVIWTTQNGVNGRLFTASNGNSLFLPAAGFRSIGSGLINAGSNGYYWSSSLCTIYPDEAVYFQFYSGSFGMSDYSRADGLFVRPVRVGSQN